MRYMGASIVLLAFVQPALAADDVSLKPAYDDYAPPYSTPTGYVGYNPWSRPYVGVFGSVATSNFAYSGEGWGSTADANLTGGGMEAGVRAGYDYAVDNFLVGAVADYALTNIKVGGDLNIGSGSWSGALESKVSQLGTIRVRAGVTQKNILYYAHGGAAFGKVDITDDGNAVPGIIDNARLGFTVGAGIEYAFSESATLQTEYSYTNLGTADIYSDGGVKVSEQIAFHKLSSGINIRF